MFLFSDFPFVIFFVEKWEVVFVLIIFIKYMLIHINSYLILNSIDKKIFSSKLEFWNFANL